MVARALWRSEALRVVPWLRPALAYGSCRVSDQGTTLRASDLHNARATILNPFNNSREWFRVENPVFPDRCHAKVEWKHIRL